MNALLLVAAAAAATVVAAPGQPISRRFAADPSPHVFGGRVYLYATDDEGNSGKYWDSTGWRLFTSPDLKRWSDGGEFARSSLFAWAGPAAKAWAPEVASRGGKYFFYAPVGGDRIGVAVADRPEGPFRDARGDPLIDKGRDANAGAEPIDPAVLIDGDGQAYMVFGTRTPKIVRLAQDMVHTDGPIEDLAVRGLTTPQELKSYGEAPFLSRHGEVYVFSFSTGWPGRIAYATSRRVTGPYDYRGVILELRRISTNHHAVLDFRGRSWLFYHDALLPGGGSYRRAITYAPLTDTADGGVAEVIAPPPDPQPQTAPPG